MIRHSKILLACFIVTLCISALAVFPVSADTGGDPDSVGNQEQRIENCLVLLEEEGIDMTEIQTAFESGDKNTVHLLLGEIRDEGLIGIGGESDDEYDDGYDESGGNECSGDRTGELKRKEQIEKHIAMIEEQGADVTDIRAALEQGDRDTVQTLLAELHADCVQGSGENGDI